MFLGERLDYCTLDGKECGQKVADRYCQQLGYDYASQSTIASNLGLTHFIATSAQCTGWQCTGFMTINCVVGLSHTPPRAYHYKEKRFAYPRINDYRLDWCYSQNKDCGDRAAHSFCARMGYMNATRYIEEPQIAATQTIGTHTLCFGSECNAFKLIVCSR
jgi:hypothetical protein